MVRPTKKNTKVFHINDVLCADKLLSSHLDKGGITADDTRLIRSYVKERIAQKSLLLGHQIKIILILSSWRRFTQEYLACFTTHE